MRISRLSILVAALVLLLAPLTAAGQGPVKPGQAPAVYARGENVRVYWDPCPPASSAPENAIVKYELAAFRSLDGGVRQTTWDDLSPTTFSFEVPTTALDRESAFLSIRCWSQKGEVSGWSNTLPFEPAGVPGVPPAFRLTATAP